MNVGNVTNSCGVYCANDSFVSSSFGDKKAGGVDGSYENRGGGTGLAVLRHDQVGSYSGSKTPSIDFATWQRDVAPARWSAKRNYQPGDQVIFGENVYQVPNGAGCSRGVMPGTDDSKWLYHGTVVNNYNYYVGNRPDSMKYDGVCANRPAPTLPSSPAVTDESNLELKGEVDALHKLRASFEGDFKEVGDYLGRIGASGARVYGGSNSSNRSSLDFDFGTYEKTVETGQRPLQEGRFAQFIYLRSGDKKSPETIDPKNYVVYNGVKNLTIKGETINVDATVILPRGWSAMEMLDARPDYGYLYVPAYKRFSLPMSVSEKQRDYLIGDSGRREYVARYEA